MSSITKRVIWMGPSDGSNQKPLNVEGLAVAATPPGSVVADLAAGLTLATIANGAFKSQFLVADKDQLRSKSVDDAWAINENMVAIAPRSGEYINVLVITAQAVVKGAPLVRSATAGALQLGAGVSTEEIVAYAEETVTTTATQLVAARVA